jgi:hypothetical protein
MVDINLTHGRFSYHAMGLSACKLRKMGKHVLPFNLNKPIKIGVSNDEMQKQRWGVSIRLGDQ